MCPAFYCSQALIDQDGPNGKAIAIMDRSSVWMTLVLGSSRIKLSMVKKCDKLKFLFLFWSEYFSREGGLDSRVFLRFRDLRSYMISDILCFLWKTSRGATMHIYDKYDIEMCEMKLMPCRRESFSCCPCIEFYSWRTNHTAPWVVQSLSYSYIIVIGVYQTLHTVLQCQPGMK